MAINEAVHSASDLWVVLEKEITGILLQWIAIDELCVKLPGNGLKTLRSDVPQLYGMMQSAFMESLLMRVSRLMDPDRTGKSTNLSLEQLVSRDACISEDEKSIRTVWNASGLKTVRDKYLGHNDLNRLMTEDHLLTIPLTEENISELGKLVEGLRNFRRRVNLKLIDADCVDQKTETMIRVQIEWLNNSLLGGKVFFDLLKSCDYEHIQQAWVDAGGD
jgi:hypothetical protein